MRIEQALACSSELSGEEAGVEVEQLLCHVLEKPRAYLYTWPERELTETEALRFRQLLRQRAEGYPVAHLLGFRGFWSFELEVNSSTLIPRADTETLVELALQLGGGESRRVADLGTGTGAIAIAVALERPDWDVWASDRVSEAVNLAQRNADRLGVSNLKILSGSWFDPLQGGFDLILSNPPYIDPADPHLNRGDLRFEPRSALTAEDAGLADLRYLIEQAPAYLNPQGWLVLEHGYDQAALVSDMLTDRGFNPIKQATDLGGNMRVTAGQWPEARV